MSLPSTIATLKDFVDHYRKVGQVTDVYAEVDPVYEAAGITAEVQDTTNNIVVFHNIKGSAMPVAMNLYGSRDRLRDLMKVEEGTDQDTLCKALNHHIAACVGATSPHQTQLRAEDDSVPARLSEMPILTHHEDDAGAYITTGILLVRDPDTGVHNLSFHRAKYVSDSELRISIGARHDLGDIQRRAEAKNEAVECAFLVGVSPAMFIAACTSIPTGADELTLAESISGEPIAFRPAKTIDLSIPVLADIVIEGKILPHVRREEAPFGEWMGNYVPVKQGHVFEVTHVSKRPGAMYHGLICGSNEDLRPLEMSTAARIYKALSGQFPGIIDVVCYPNMLMTSVKVKQSYEGHGKQVLLAAVTAHFLYSKICVVVDDDVDIYSLEDVMWAYTTRARPDERTTVLANVPGFFRDPHKDHWGRLALDATIPWGREEEFKRKMIPGRKALRARLSSILAVKAS